MTFWQEVFASQIEREWREMLTVTDTISTNAMTLEQWREAITEGFKRADVCINAQIEKDILDFIMDSAIENGFLSEEEYKKKYNPERIAGCTEIK